MLNLVDALIATVIVRVTLGVSGRTSAFRVINAVRGRVQVRVGERIPAVNVAIAVRVRVRFNINVEVAVKVAIKIEFGAGATGLAVRIAGSFGGIVRVRNRLGCPFGNVANLAGTLISTVM